MPTYRLETFGKLALSGSESAPLSHQRRRLALLAILAAAGERGLSRDQLLAYLWADSSAANGRHSLEQLLHAMRKALGEQVFSGVNPVRLNSEVIASDVTEFELAFARGSFAEAVALYDGPFLSGFYLEDAPEFERWTGTERARLADRYMEALGRLGDAAENIGDYAAAVRWRRRAVEADPLGSRAALAFMRALVASGDRTAALQHARIYEALVKQEFESAPDPSIVAYAAEVRDGGGDDLRKVSGVGAAVTTGRQMPSSPASDNSIDRLPVQAPVESAHSAQPTTRESAISATQEETATRSPGWRLAAIPVAVAILLIIAVFNRSGDDASAFDANKIVVVPFRTTGADSSLKYLDEGAVDLIAPMLTGEGGPVAVDSRTAISAWNRVTRGRDGTADDARQVARELGAGIALTGAMVDVGGTLTITGSVVSAAGGNPRPLTSVTGPSDSVHALLNRFVGQLLVQQSGVAATSVAAVTSQSLPAIRAYLDGRRAYRRADENRAIESFSRALDIDSTFALAALDLAVATGKLLRAEICRNEACRVFSIVPGFASSERDDDLFDRAVRLAWEHRQKLGRRDRPLLDALRGENYPRASSARETLADLGRAVREAPDRPETHYLLGTLLLYQGTALGLSDSRERAEAAFRAASRLDPTYLPPLVRMVDVAAFSGDTTKLRRAAVLYLARDTAGGTGDYVRWLLAAGTRDINEQRAIRARLRSLPRGTLEQIYFTGLMSGLGLEDADSAAALITESSTDPIEKSVALRRGQMLALNRGRPSEATRLLRRVDELRSAGYTFRQFAIAAAIFQDGEQAVADSSARDLARSLARDTLGALAPDAIRRISTAMAILSLWHIERGDTAPAAKASDWLKRHALGQARNRVLQVLPELLLASKARRPEGARLRALVDSVMLDGCCELPEFVILALAQAYEESGDVPRALRVIQRGAWHYPPRQLSTYLREEGRLAARLGNRANAVRAYEHYLALRSNPEPSLRPERDSIRAEVTRLRNAR